MQRLIFELFLLCQEACKLGTAYVKLQGEHEALKKKHAEDNGKVMLPEYSNEVQLFRLVILLQLNLQRLRRMRSMQR